MMRTAVLIAAAVLTLALGGRAEAQPPEAQRLYQEGQQAYDERRYDAALALWHRSYELSKLPGLLFNLGQAYRRRGEAGDCARAADSYQRFIELDPRSARRATAESWLQKLEACANASPRPPDDPPVSPDRSDDKLDAPPPAVASRDPEAAARPRADAGSVRYEMRDTGGSKRSAGLILAGGGAAAALAGLYFGNRARQLADEVSAACTGGCRWPTIAPRDAEGRAAERTQWILYGAGAGGLLVGATLYYLGTRDRAPAIAVTPHRGGGTIAWSGRW